MTRTTIALASVLFATVCACERSGNPPIDASAPPATQGASAALPDYLARLEKSGDLYARDGGAIVSAPDADLAVLRGYPRWQDKGPLTGPAGERLTIMTAKTVYAAGESVRVIHVHEATKPGAELYVMGPKEIFGEYVDGQLASKAAAAPASAYDGAVIPSPGEDHNYEVSEHRLAPGVHTIEWRFATLSGPTVLRSNVLRVEIR